MSKPFCFCCGEKIECAIRDDSDESHWEMPCGVHFTGGGNYGSTVFDALMEECNVEIVICDKCFSEKKTLARKFRVSHETHKEVIEW